MTHVGVDIEQFVADPYGSGIQRVLQQLARQWPTEISADFVVPDQGQFLLLSPPQAADLFDLAFAAASDDELRQLVPQKLQELRSVAIRVDLGRLMSLYSGWILPEVSYLPSVLERFELFARVMPTSMIGYDTLPMTEPSNYRFTPGTAAYVSQYFRLLRDAPRVVCISGFSRDSILNRLRRDRRFPISVAHPGGDHLAARLPKPVYSKEGPIHFVRLGTLEARKFPRELVEAFATFRSQGGEARLTFVGRPSASDQKTNEAVRRAADQDIGVDWIPAASDEDVQELIEQADVFLSMGSEGYGIPVLESIRRGTPVVYGGIQPAAELMFGSGAADWEDLSPRGLVQMFDVWSNRERVASLYESLDPEAVPCWDDFAAAVARSVQPL